jgi:integrase
MLNSKQLRAVWDILEHPPLRCAQAVDPIKLMLLTACRSGEILGLTWDEVKPTRLELKTAKSGPREVPLNKPAQKLLKSLRKENFSRFVFPSEKSKSGHLMCIDQSWRTIKARAGLPDDFRIHDLRHTYASHAILSGETLTMTGRLLGHASLHSTQRYAHLDGSILVKASEKVSKEIAKLMQ